MHKLKPVPAGIRKSVSLDNGIAAGAARERIGRRGEAADDRNRPESPRFVVVEGPVIFKQPVSPSSSHCHAVSSVRR